MLDRRFKAGFTKEYLERYKADPDSIVFEITEREAVRDSEEFKELVNHYKKQGFKTAIDDVGAGYSGLKRIVDVVPQFIKLDISLIRDIHLNSVSASIVKSMTAFANENGIRLIAEGIETREEQEMENCIKTGEVYSVYYLDLDNFKAYNDIYGFENGDKIICALAETLCEVVNREGFVGHIGGDDFVLIVRGEYPAGNIRRIEEKFAEKIRPLYSEADLKRGYIEAVNRQGEYDRFPIVSVTTVGITNKSRKYNSQYEMSEELALLKKKEKRLKQEHFRKELA